MAVVQNSVLAASSEKDKDVNILEEYLGKLGVGVMVKKFASYPEAVDALKMGAVSGIGASELNLKRFGLKGMLLLPERFLPSRYCVQVRSDFGRVFPGGQRLYRRDEAGRERLPRWPRNGIWWTIPRWNRNGGINEERTH